MTSWTHHDPWRWAWMALALLTVALLGSDAATNDKLSGAEQMLTVLLAVAFATPFLVMSRSSISIRDGLVTVVNQGRRHRAQTSEIVAVELRRARVILCAHLELRSGASIPVAAVSAIENRRTGTVREPPSLAELRRALEIPNGAADDR